MNKPAIFFAAVVVTLVALAAPRVVALSQPIRDLKNTAVTCGASATLISPTGGASSMLLQNSSTTCVRVGGSGVTTSTGVSIGSGCPAGQVIGVDATRGWCAAESSTVAIQILYGVN